MGAKYLWKLLKTTEYDYSNRVLCIDTSIWIHSLAYSSNIAKTACFRIIKLLFNGIKPYFVFDGPPTMLKRMEQRRKNKREREEKLFVRNILFNRKCNLCYGILNKCEHSKIKYFDDDKVMKKMKNHKYKWGDVNNERHEILIESELLVENENLDDFSKNQINKVLEKKKVKANIIMSNCRKEYFFEKDIAVNEQKKNGDSYTTNIQCSNTLHNSTNLEDVLEDLPSIEIDKTIAKIDDKEEILGAASVEKLPVKIKEDLENVEKHDLSCVYDAEITINEKVRTFLNENIQEVVVDNKSKHYDCIKNIETRRDVEETENEEFKNINTEKDGYAISFNDNSIENIIKQLIMAFSLPIVISVGESDPQCAQMCKDGIADGVISDDNDLLIYGSPVVIRHFFDNKKSPKCYSLNKCGYSVDNLIKLAFLLGCDYCNPKCGPKKAISRLEEDFDEDFAILEKEYKNEGIKIEPYNFTRPRWNKICICLRGLGTSDEDIEILHSLFLKIKFDEFF